MWNGQGSKGSRRLLPAILHDKARRRLNRVVLAESPKDCSIFPGFKRLHGKIRNLYQFRLDDHYRVRFAWENGRAVKIEIGAFHDDDK